MVMGPTHATQGLAAGLAVSNLAPLLSLPMDIPKALTLGMIGAGAAIAADLDHPRATATHSIGPISRGASIAIRALSAYIYRRTKTKYDRGNADGHRGITHTFPGAIGLGAFFGGIIAAAGAWNVAAAIVSTLVVIWLFLVWALRALPPEQTHFQDYVVATLLTGGAYWALADGYSADMPWLLGAVISIGTGVHCLGDGLTLDGVPWFFPIKIRGQRWYSAGMPRFLRFRAGGPVEYRLVVPLSLAAVGAALIWLVPGAWPWIFGKVALLWA